MLQALQEQDIPPQLIVLPEYPAAGTSSAPEFGKVDKSRVNPLLALAGDIPCCYAPRAKQQEMINAFTNHGIELLLVACWPYLIDRSIVEHLDGAAINLHPSKLPRFRGADPIAAQLAANHRPFAVSLHKLTERYDEGDLLAQEEFEIAEENPLRQVVERACARRGTNMFNNLLQQDMASWRCWPQ